MKIVYTRYYCDICGGETDFPRFIHIKRKIFKINMWGVNYDCVCEGCMNSIGDTIKLLKGVKHGSTDKAIQ